jgi:hypothetical protein
MGDWAALALDGVLCQHCGTYLSEGCGYPRSCPGCEWADRATIGNQGASLDNGELTEEEEDDVPF